MTPFAPARALLLFTALSACSSAPTGATPDAASGDAGTPDAPATVDAGGADTPVALDVGRPDAPAVADIPVADIPVADIPVADIPVADITVADIPVADIPVVDSPVADVPVADTPVVVDAGAADVPAVADVPADVPRDVGADAGPAVFDIPRRVPAGALESPVVTASATIGPAGGTLSFGRAFTLRVPAGALAAPTTLTVRASTRDIPTSERALSAVYTLGPSGTTFAVPAEATITAAVDPSPDAVGVALRSDGGATEHLTATRVGAAYTARIPHFTEVYVERAGPDTPLAASPCTRTPAPPAPPLFTLFPREGVARSFVRPAYVRAVADGFDVSVYAAADATDDVRFRHFSDLGAPASPAPRAVSGNVFARVRGGDFAAHPDGGSVVVYSSNVMGGLEIWARRVSADGTPQGAAVRLSEDPYLSEEPRIAATHDGFVVAWRSFDEARNVTSIETVALTRALARGPQARVVAGDPVVQSAPGYFEVVSTGPLAAVVYNWQLRSNLGIRLQRLLSDGSLLGPVIDAVPLPEGAALPVSYALSTVAAGDDAVLAWTTAAMPQGLRTMRVSLLTGEYDRRAAYTGLGTMSLVGIARDGDGFVVGHQFTSATDAANPLHTGMVRLDAIRAPREQRFDVGVSGTTAYPVAVAARPGGRYAVAWMYAGTRDTGAMTWDDPSTLQFVGCP